MNTPQPRFTRFIPQPLEAVPDQDQQAYVRAWATARIADALAIEARYPHVLPAEWRKLIGP